MSCPDQGEFSDAELGMNLAPFVKETRHASFLGQRLGFA